MAICRVYWAKPNLGILSLYSVHLLPGLLIAKKLLKSLWFSPLPQPTPRYILIKMPQINDKETILKVTREKRLVTYKGANIRLSTDFLKETLKVRRDWHEIF